MLDKLKKAATLLLLVVAGLAGGNYLSGAMKSDTNTTTKPASATNAEQSSNEKLPLLTSLYLTAMDPPKSKYAVNVGQFYLTERASSITALLDQKGYTYKVFQTRDANCTVLTIVATGELKNQQDAWALVNRIKLELNLGAIPIKLPAPT